MAPATASKPFFPVKRLKTVFPVKGSLGPIHDSKANPTLSSIHGLILHFFFPVKGCQGLFLGGCDNQDYHNRGDYSRTRVKQ